MVDFIRRGTSDKGMSAHAMIRIPGERESVNDPDTCRHLRTQLIAKDSDAEYVECLDCGAILEVRRADRAAVRL